MQGLPRPSSLFTACFVFQCFIKITAAYGSTKDISVYSVLGLPASQIFIVGRPTKKYQTQCQVCGGPGKESRAAPNHSVTCSSLHLLMQMPWAGPPAGRRGESKWRRV